METALCAALADPVETVEAKGWVDEFDLPNRIVGWALPVSRPEMPCRVVATLRGQLIGSTSCTEARADLAHLGNTRVGFVLDTDASVTDMDWLNGDIVVSLRGEFGDLPLRVSQDLLDAARFADAARKLSQFQDWTDDRLERICTRVSRGVAMEPRLHQQMMKLIEFSGRPVHSEVHRRLSDRLREPFESVADDGNGLSPTKLMNEFESLGFNCEFGFVQKHYGCEAIGLLRWASVPFDSLIACLNSDFQGVGEAENTELLPMWLDSDEFGTRDIRYDLSSHTFVAKKNIIDPKREFGRQLAILQWMRDNLLIRLRGRQKIFVFQIYDRVSDQQAYALSSALGRFGRNTLLCVRTAEPGRPNGYVEVLRPNLMVGYIDQWSREDAVPDHIQFGSWLRICRKAHRLATRWHHESVPDMADVAG